MKLNLTKTQLLFIVFITTLSLFLFIAALFFLVTRNSTEVNLSIDNPPDPCVPAFADGGGPYYQPNQPFRENIAEGIDSGQKLIVSGRVLNSNCTKAVPDIVIDIWQASDEGEYEDEYYRGQIISDERGRYRFETVMPLGYGEGTAYRPPHIHFKLFSNNTELITSQMFFEDTRDLEGFNDAYIIDVVERDGVLYGSYDIVIP